MVALIREPPRDDGPGAADLAALEPRRGRRLGDRPRGGRRRPPAGGRLLVRASIDEIVEFLRREFALATARRDAAAGAVDRSGSRSSTSRRARRRSRSSRRCAAARARAPATPARSIRSRRGCCVLLSGAATRLAPCFVGLDKRYVTDVDLDGDDHDGRPRGRDRRAARAARRGRARRAPRARSAARSSCRSRPPRR